MPNLQQVIDSQQLLDESVARMMSGQYERSEVVINDGFRTPADVDAHVSNAPVTCENIQDYQYILEAGRERNSSR